MPEDTLALIGRAHQGDKEASTTAGKNNMFHREFLLKNLFINHNYEPPGQNCQGEIELSAV